MLKYSVRIEYLCYSSATSKYIWAFYALCNTLYLKKPFKHGLIHTNPL